MMDNILFQILVFPGLVFLLAWTFFVFYFARKVLARIHKRVGPHFNGPAGSLQTIFDVFKLLTKENITPKSVDPYLFNIIPLITPIVAALPVILIPWTPWMHNGVVLDTDYEIGRAHV